MSGALLHAALVKLGFVVNIDLNNNAFQSSDEDGFTVTGNFRMNNAATWNYTGDIFGTNESGNWGLPSGGTPGDDYHTRLVFISGLNQYVSGEALNTWLALTSNRQWNFSKASAGGPDQTVGTYRVDISDDGGSTTLDSQQFTVTLVEQTP